MVLEALSWNKYSHTSPLILIGGGGWHLSIKSFLIFDTSRKISIARGKVLLKLYTGQVERTSRNASCYVVPKTNHSHMLRDKLDSLSKGKSSRITENQIGDEVSIEE